MISNPCMFESTFFWSKTSINIATFHDCGSHIRINSFLCFFKFSFVFLKNFSAGSGHDSLLQYKWLPNNAFAILLHHFIKSSTFKKTKTALNLAVFVWCKKLLFPNLSSTHNKYVTVFLWSTSLLALAGWFTPLGLRTAETATHATFTSSVRVVNGVHR